MKQFGKVFLTGLVIGLVIGIGVVAAASCPPLLVMPAILIFVLASSPAFAWAGSSAGMLVIATSGVFSGLATAAVLETFDRVSSLAWRACRFLFAATSAQPQDDGTARLPESFSLMSKWLGCSNKSHNNLSSSQQRVENLSSSTKKLEFNSVESIPIMDDNEDKVDNEDKTYSNKIANI